MSLSTITSYASSRYGTGVASATLAEGARYRDASLCLRRLGVDVDAASTGRGGLLVVEERTLLSAIARSAITVGRGRPVLRDRLRAPWPG
ncbi:MAG: hypothetical protein GIX03_02095 [Candidatus Eremiobacteraeota bacterium]|nr:hypothetical protein [Candidatus Eremiobacteraeota bacterium]MBC5801809.1 hypothetical protein [Candidatus Eremiobacteraeota bacterium]MBC5821022.1 hypothetical protein [Candidatus Eremiobacteraeota bacterium]